MKKYEMFWLFIYYYYYWEKEKKNVNNNCLSYLYHDKLILPWNKIKSNNQ